jgi:hypothetical protein
MIERAPLTRWAIAIAAATLGLHLVTIYGYGWFRDEFYYLACAARLDWGYVDHPPGVAVITALTRAILGDSIVALRLPPAVAHVATVFVTALIARDLGAGRFGQTLAALAVAVAPVLLALSSYVSMNAYDVLVWTSVLFLLVRMIDRDRPRDWVWIGALIGLGFENKHSLLFLAFGIAAGVVVAGPRRQLLTSWPWLGGAVAALLAAPNVIWQVAHGWPTLEFMRNATAHKNVALAPGAFLTEQLNQMNPFSAPVWVAGLVWLLLGSHGARWRAVGIGYLAILGVFLLTAAKPYYLAAYYPVLFAAGGCAIEQWTRTRRFGQPVRAVVVSAVVVGGAIGLPLALPVLSEERFIAYQSALGVHPESGERHKQGALPQFYADMHGWVELVDVVSAAARQLSPGERQTAFVFGQNYGQAGAVEWLGRNRDLPPVRSGHNNYWLWGPGDNPGRTGIIIGGDREDNASVCTTLIEAGRVRSPYAMPYEDDKPVYICRGLTPGLKELWPRLKHFE